MKHKATALLVCGILLASPAFGQRAQVWTLGGAYLGVELRDIGSDDVADLGLPRESGVYIEDVAPDSPAARAGLQAGDVIVTFSGIAVLSVRQFQRLVSDSPAGRNIDLEVVRGGSKINLAAQLEEGGLRSRSDFLPNFAPRGRVDVPPEIRMLPDLGDYRFAWSSRPRLGVAGESLTEQLADHLQVPGKEGILVMEVMEGSPAEKAGIQAGDVILSVDGNSVSSISELARHIRSGNLEIELVRQARVMKVEVEIETPGARGRRTKL